MQVQQYHTIDLPVTSTATVDNPFFAKLAGTFVGPSGQELTIPGFYDGGGRWIVRFSPAELGTWRWNIRSDDLLELSASGEITCVPNTHPLIHGGLGINPENPRYFRHADGSDYFMLAYEVDWLFALYMQDPHRCTSFVDKLASYRFNSMIMNVYAHECSWSDKTAPGLITPPPLYPWEGSNEAPDHGRLNIAFWQQFDGLMNLLLERGITAHLFFYVYNKSVNWPAKGSAEDGLYLDYIVARYQAYANVIWDYAKETYYQNDKDYLTQMLQRIKAHDAYGRLLTIHDDKRYWADDRSAIVDFKSLQHHQDFNALPQLEYAMRPCPVLNCEYGYECGPGGMDDITYGEGNPIPEFMDRTYNVVMGGAYPGYYYTYTAWDILRTEDTPPGYRAWQAMYDLMTSLPWWRFTPCNQECMWTPTACFANKATGEYLLKMNAHGRFLMDRNLAELNVEGTWTQIVTGEQRPLTIAHYRPFEISPTMTVITSPFRSLGVLRLRLGKHGAPA